MSSFPDNIKSTALVVAKPQIHQAIPVKISIEKIRHWFAQQSLTAQLTDHQYFHRYAMGDIVILVGTSTAGKTSIIKALKQLKPECIEDGGDLRTDELFLDYFKKHYPEEVAILEKVLESADIPKAVLSPERSWKRGALHLDKIDAEEAIQRIKQVLDPQAIDAQIPAIEPQMIDDALALSHQGRSVIFDVLKVENVAQHVFSRNFTGPLKIALVYCPFYLLSSRIEKRNREAEENGQFMNQRIGPFPLIQFSQLYMRKQEKQQTLEIITRTQAIETFEENFDRKVRWEQATGHPLPPEEEIRAEKARQTQFFLDDLGFEEGMDTVAVAPRHQSFYNVFLNSGTLPAAQSAKILCEL